MDQLEMQSLLAECKKNIIDILKEVVKNPRLDSYKQLSELVFTSNDESITRWFNTQTDHMASRSKVCAYDDARKKLELAFQDAAQNKQVEEHYMLKIEKLLGAFIKKKFLEFDILYSDNENAVQKDMSAQKRRFRFQGYLLGFLAGVLIFAASCLFGVVGGVIGVICGCFVMLLIGKIYYSLRMAGSVAKL